ncbi:putative cytochrome P450 [Septoria linicola]|nr:putative cytochrome P450 [Septoria linicola]
MERVHDTHEKSLVLALWSMFRVWHGLVILFSFVSLTATYRIWLHPLRKIPGPLLARATELWRTSKYARGNWHDDILDLHRQYGPVVRIAPNEVSFVDKEALVKVYGHSTGTRKTSWYDVWEVKGAGTSLFSATDPREHAFLRKRVATAYSMSTILSLEDKIQGIADVLWQKLHDLAAQGETVNVGDWTNYFAFDVVGKLGLGDSLGLVEHGRDVNDIVRSVHGFFYISSNLGYLPGQKIWIENPLSQALSAILAPAWMLGFPKFSTWLGKQVADRMSEGEVKKRVPDMLDRFIEMKDPDGEQVRYPGVLVEAGNLLGAGGDTTAIAMAVVVGQLLVHPEMYRRVQDEIDGEYCKHEDDWKLDYRSAEALPWLHACIKEGTRMCPSILWQLPHEAPAEGIEIAGFDIPSTATLSMSTISQNRCKDIWGDDADEWRPSRWIVGEDGTTPEYLREIEKYNVLFGYGSRTCVGRNLAMVEVHKFVGQFLRHFDCELVNPGQPFQRRSQWFCVQENLLVKLSSRSH